ncbi:hypothetical protein NOVOSPHI9U_90002 [Novosphingobium sp. 9U]|nr:hypothetical protein NOVOSPHI9U_90002 [Novosphingobium sp. 9U]
MPPAGALAHPLRVRFGAAPLRRWSVHEPASMQPDMLSKGSRAQTLFVVDAHHGTQVSASAWCGLVRPGG